MAKSQSTDTTASGHIDARIAELGDWRGAMLGKLRAIIKRADPDVVETWKWRGVPVWEDEGIICTGETYKAVVKMTFAHGAKLDDPSKLFNSSLAGGTRRAIDVAEGETIDDKALIDLVRAAVAFNRSKTKPKASSRKTQTEPKKPAAKAKKPAAKAKKPAAKKKPTAKATRKPNK